MKSLWVLFFISIASCSLMPDPVNSTNQAISNAKAEIVSPTRKMDSIFLRMPSAQDIEQIILSADSFALAKLIQTISLRGFDLPCQALSLYSDEIIGMIKVVIEKRTLLADQLQIIIDMAQLQMDRLTKQISKITDERNVLKLKETMVKLEGLVAALDIKYGQYNEEKKKLEPQMGQVFGYQTEIENLQRIAKQDRKLLITKKLQITDYDNAIKKLQENLQLMKNRKTSTLIEITKIQQRITKTQLEIQKGKQKIEQIENEIKLTNRRSDALKKDSIRLEIEVERVREEISTAFYKDRAMSQKIDELQERVEVERRKLAYRELEYTRYLVKVLNTALPKFVKQNNEIRYDCFGVGSVQLVQSGETVVYLIRGERVMSYLNNAYTIPQSQLKNNVSDVSLTVCDVFDAAWSYNYGSFKDEEQLLSQNSNAFFKDDFTCLNPSQVRSFQGIITSISNNKIQVLDSYKRQVTAIIGACSRIQSTKSLPEVGQKIYFKGIEDSHVENGTQLISVNLYSATCL